MLRYLRDGCGAPAPHSHHASPQPEPAALQSSLSEGGIFNLQDGGKFGVQLTRFTLVRLPSAYLTGQLPPFPETLTTPAIGPEQLSVVSTLALQPESGGPTPISCTARLLQAATSASFPRLRGALSAVQFRPWAPF